jgi:hypothetical protein
MTELQLFPAPDSSVLKPAAWDVSLITQDVPDENGVVVHAHEAGMEKRGLIRVNDYRIRKFNYYFDMWWMEFWGYFRKLYQLQSLFKIACEQRSRYSYWLRAGGPRGQSSSFGRVKNFLFSTSSRSALGPTQPPIQWLPGVKRAGRETDHSPQTSADVKKLWIYTSTPPYTFMAQCLIS